MIWIWKHGSIEIFFDDIKDTNINCETHITRMIAIKNNNIGVVEIMPNVKNNRCQNILWTVGSIHVNAQDIPMDSTRPSRESAK